MMDVSGFIEELEENNVGLIVGVPDSLLKEFCSGVEHHENHVIAPNEGAAIGIAAGAYLSSGRIPLVYMQNSGLGNAINPLTSLADPAVYAIPMVLLIGWRGEPGVKDEPQHVKQGSITPQLLDTIGVPYHVLTDSRAVREAFEDAQTRSGPVALLVQKGTFVTTSLEREESTAREAVIESIITALPPDAAIVSTTGKTSRELYEIRERNGQGHEHDFLTVGSMGHASQIALGISKYSKKHIVCLDGDGAALMHLGGMSAIGTHKANLLHVILNNKSHESVGGQPTSGPDVDFVSIALACGYKRAQRIEGQEDIHQLVRDFLVDGPNLIEVRIEQGSRKNLARPREKPTENKEAFIRHLRS